MLQLTALRVLCIVLGPTLEMRCSVREGAQRKFIKMLPGLEDFSHGARLDRLAFVFLRASG